MRFGGGFFGFIFGFSGLGWFGVFFLLFFVAFKLFVDLHISKSLG